MSDDTRRNERCAHGVRWPHECKDCLHESELAAVPGSDCVSWHEGVLEMKPDASLDGVDVWVLKVKGRTVLTAVPSSDIVEAVSAEDRRMIGQALADALSNLNTERTGTGGENL